MEDKQYAERKCLKTNSIPNWTKLFNDKQYTEQKCFQTSSMLSENF